MAKMTKLMSLATAAAAAVMIVVVVVIFLLLSFSLPLFWCPQKKSFANLSMVRQSINVVWTNGAQPSVWWFIQLTIRKLLNGGAMRTNLNMSTFHYQYAQFTHELLRVFHHLVMCGPKLFGSTNKQIQMDGCYVYCLYIRTCEFHYMKSRVYINNDKSSKKEAESAKSVRVMNKKNQPKPKQNQLIEHVKHKRETD